MKIFIGYQSALEYWRVHRVLPGSKAYTRRNIELPSNPPSTEQVKLSGLTLPLHIMIRKRGNRWASQTMTQHVFSGNAPANCFVSVDSVKGNGLEVSSPEFCFLQMAGRLSLAALIELGYEFCGTYSIVYPIHANC